MSNEINLDYILSVADQDSNRIGELFGMPEVYELNLTVEYSYYPSEPRTMYDPGYPERYEIEGYYIAGIYVDGKFRQLTKDQSDQLLLLQPPIIDDLKFLQDVIAAHNGSLDSGPF